MQIVFFGDSHVHALIRAKAKLVTNEDILAIDVRRIDDPQTNSKEIPKSLAAQFPADAVFCCLGGTEFNLLGLIETEEPFDFLSQAGDTILPNRKPVPNSLIRAALIFRMQSALNRMAEIRKQYRCPFTCVAPPPPPAELNDINGLPQAFLPHLERGIAPPSVRLKLYKLQVELLKEYCNQHNITFMPAPTSSIDKNGYLKRELWNNDPTHGNAHYGKAVITQIRSLQLV